MSKCKQAREVKIQVVRSEGEGCPLGFKEGDEFTVSSAFVPEGMCAWAWQSIFPFVATLRLGGKIPWSDDCYETEAMCPDSKAKVVFKIKALKP